MTVPLGRPWVEVPLGRPWMEVPLGRPEPQSGSEELPWNPILVLLRRATSPRSRWNLDTYHGH